METLEELKANRDNAPHDATHLVCSMSVKYLKLDSKFEWHEAIVRGCNGYLWECVDSNGIGYYHSIRSISDIERIIELMECLKSIEQTVDGGDVLGCWDMMKIKDCLK